MFNGFLVLFLQYNIYGAEVVPALSLIGVELFIVVSDLFMQLVASMI